MLAADPSHPHSRKTTDVDLLFQRWVSVVSKRFKVSDNRGKQRGPRVEEEEEDVDPPFNKDEEIEIWRSVFEELQQEDDGWGSGGDALTKARVTEAPKKNREMAQMSHERFLEFVPSSDFFFFFGLFC